MAIKKSDLYSTIWQSCDQLRGGMDASQYKDYVLFMLFIKYISDKYADTDVFAPPLVIPKGSSFSDMLELRGKSDIGDRINKHVIALLVDANDNLGVADFPDFNDPNKLGQGKEMVDRLTNLIDIFANRQLDFSQNRAEHDDVLGDAYEYLMRHFATQSGKSKGQFYTPAEVSRVIAKVIGIAPDNTKASTTAYDPTCGSGSLLLKVATQAEKPITLEGQEKDVTTAGLARMNMILHDFPTAKIVSGNTLTDPKFKDGSRLATYDYVVANPPFSDKTWTTGLIPSMDEFERFTWGEPPAGQGDYAYLLHIIRSLKSTGKAACVLPHGVLFRGGAEATIRRQLVLSGYLKGIIGLPPNLFYGTGIPACIVVLDKENAAGRKGVFMIDASRGFQKDGPKNRLRDQDIHKIVDTFSQLVDVPRYARMVSFDEIGSERNDFNLNLPRYVDVSDDEDLHDLEGHLRGGIPQRDVDSLQRYWKAFPSLRISLFDSAGRPDYLQLRIDLGEIRTSILEHEDFATFQRAIADLFSVWTEAALPRLQNFGSEENPKKLIEVLSERLLETMRRAKLLDPYDVYQRLMDYWWEFMQDDVYLISSLDWIGAAQPREIFQVKGKNGKPVWPEPHDYLIGKRRFKSDLLPAPLLVTEYFSNESASLNELEKQLAALEQQLDELKEIHGGEDGLLSEVTSDKQSISKTAVTARIKVVKDNQFFSDELVVLEKYNSLLKNQSKIKKKRNECQQDLYMKTHHKYTELTKVEIKKLVVHDKWLVHMSSCVQLEVENVSQTLNNRIRELSIRYANPLPGLTAEMKRLDERVEEHLGRIVQTSTES